MPSPRPFHLPQVLPSASADALSLLCSLLCFNPNERSTAADAMRSGYCSQGAWVQAADPNEPPPHARQGGKPRPVAADLKFNDSVKRHTSDYREGIYELVDRLASEDAKSGGRVVNARPSRNPEARGGG